MEVVLVVLTVAVVSAAAVVTALELRTRPYWRLLLAIAWAAGVAWVGIANTLGHSAGARPDLVAVMVAVNVVVGGAIGFVVAFTVATLPLYLWRARRWALLARRGSA